MANIQKNTHSCFPFCTIMQINISVSLPLVNDISYQTSLKSFSFHLHTDVKQTIKSLEHLTVCEMNK